jgi:hypothetical protein
VGVKEQRVSLSGRTTRAEEACGALPPASCRARGASRCASGSAVSTRRLSPSAVEKSLAGRNESARINAVKFLAELEAWRPDECERRATAEAFAGTLLLELAQLGLNDDDEEFALFHLLDVADELVGAPPGSRWFLARDPAKW